MADHQLTDDDIARIKRHAEELGDDRFGWNSKDASLGSLIEALIAERATAVAEVLDCEKAIAAQVQKRITVAAALEVQIAELRACLRLAMDRWGGWDPASPEWARCEKALSEP